MKNALLIIVVLALIAIAGAAAKFAKPGTPDVDNKSDLIRVTSPLPNSEVKSPLVITGKARGTWFFEASFPIVMVDWDGRIIGEGHAEAKENWMTQDFVPFEATLTFNVDSNAYSNRGALILKKDNPSGLPEHDDAIEIPVVLIGASEPAKITAKLGEKININGVSITPIEVTQDSRCGSDVVCIWAGTVELKTKLESGASSTTTILTLNKALTFAGKKVTLEKVEPHPSSKANISASDYRFTFSVN
ncbi:MAG TPA: Gmad2 immunoglobulin-like domain-containing protein [Candidatus Paceibacterota bacterium]